MIEQTPEKDIKQKQNNHNDEEIEIDLIGILRKIIGIRKTIYKAAGIGLVVGIIAPGGVYPGCGCGCLGMRPPAVPVDDPVWTEALCGAGAAGFCHRHCGVLLRPAAL